MFSGSIPSAMPFVFSSFGFTEKPNTRTSDATNTHIMKDGTDAKMPTSEFVTKYMKSNTPAQPNSANAVESGNRQTPFHSRS